MKYVNADVILPEELLIEIQKYIQGIMVYIPIPKGHRKKWGENSGSRTYLSQRNETIRQQYSDGLTIAALSEEYCLSSDSIKKLFIQKSKVYKITSYFVWCDFWCAINFSNYLLYIF